MLDIVNLPTVNLTNGTGVDELTALGAVTVPSAGTASVDAHIESINILLPKLKQITADLEAEIGGHILAIKAAVPNEWETVVKVRCGISRSRAFELMRIADGTKTAEQTRRETNARKIKYRANQAVRSGTDTEITELKAAHRRELADARTRIAEAEKARERQAVRFEHKLIELSDARGLDSERDQLRKALGGVVELLAEMRGLLTHAERNRAAIARKITRAETIATSALKPAKAAVVNLSAKQAA
jgi:hypothetical protein